VHLSIVGEAALLDDVRAVVECMKKSMTRIKYLISGLLGCVVISSTDVRTGLVCAVKRRGSSVGENPTRELIRSAR
jgi:hypothetical protein